MEIRYENDIDERISVFQYIWETWGYMRCQRTTLCCFTRYLALSAFGTLAFRISSNISSDTVGQVYVTGAGVGQFIALLAWSRPSQKIIACNLTFLSQCPMLMWNLPPRYLYILCKSIRASYKWQVHSNGFPQTVNVPRKSWRFSKSSKLRVVRRLKERSRLCRSGVGLNTSLSSVEILLFLRWRWRSLVSPRSKQLWRRVILLSFRRRVSRLFNPSNAPLFISVNWFARRTNLLKLSRCLKAPAGIVVMLLFSK